jgi:hypothetical protein
MLISVTRFLNADAYANAFAAMRIETIALTSIHRKLIDRPENTTFCTTLFAPIMDHVSGILTNGVHNGVFRTHQCPHATL